MPFGDWKVCDTGEWGLARSGFCPTPTLSEPENQSQSELLRDAYSSFHLWVRQNQLTFPCGLEMKEMLQKTSDGECRESKGELACVWAPRGAAQRHLSTLS